MYQESHIATTAISAPINTFGLQHTLVGVTRITHLPENVKRDAEDRCDRKGNDQKGVISSGGVLDGLLVARELLGLLLRGGGREGLVTSVRPGV